MTDTHVCGWVGSSPRETVSPWISLKHFSQKWYLSAISPNFGELHRSPKHSRSRTAHGREGSHRSVQDMGRVRCHERSKQEVGAQHSTAGSRHRNSQAWFWEVRGGVEGEGRREGGRGFGGVHGWSRQKQANVDSTTIDGGGGGTDKSDGAETGRDNTQQRAEAKALIRNFGHERMSNSKHHHGRQSRSRIDKELGLDEEEGEVEQCAT